MAFVVQLTGGPGTGKTFSMKSLTEKYPDSVYYINCDGKPLAWAGWRSQFSKDKKNYIETSDVDTITTVLKGISSYRSDIKVVIVDTITAIENDMEMRDFKKSSFDESICRIKTHLIAGITLELYTLQHNHETWISANVQKV